MKVLALVTFNIYPPLMGGQKGVALFYQYLSHHHQIYMAGVAGDDAVAPGSITFLQQLYANKKMLGNIFHIRSLKKIIIQQGIDCIIAEHSYTAWIAYLLRRWIGVPFIIHSHNIESYRFRYMNRRWWKLYALYEKWMHQAADYNFFISEQDKQLAEATFHLSTQKSVVITYGVEKRIRIPQAKAMLRQQLGLQNEILLFFNGTLDYEPNRQAVQHLVHDIIPLLKNKIAPFKILITGNRIQPGLQHLVSLEDTILYKGYVDNIDLYYQGSDCFINPVINSSGVKTKVIEAIANQCPVVSTASGAAGIPVAVCGAMLVIKKDHDWTQFVDAIAESVMEGPASTPPSFYQYYNWVNIAGKAAAAIQSVSSK